MGVFDLRCCLSGLSVRGDARPDPFDCSMILLEQAGDVFVPVMLPVTGSYDRYGRIELPARDRAERAHAEWMGFIYELLWDDSVLRSTWPDGLRDINDLGGPAATFLAHAADSVFNAFELTLSGRRVHPCLFRDDVAREIAASASSAPCAEEQRFLDRINDATSEAYSDWLDARGRPIQAAYVRGERERARSGLFDDPPAATRAVIERFRCVMRHMEARGGLRPIRATEALQHGDEDLERFADEAWSSGDPVLRVMVGRWRDADALAREMELPFHETAAERALAGIPVGLDAVTAVLHAQGLSENDLARLVDAIARAPEREAILTALQAPRAAEIVTEGEGDLHEITRYHGARFAADRLTDELSPRLDVERALVERLVEPMFSHAMIAQTLQRVTHELWDWWYDVDARSLEGLYVEPLVTSYATLARHTDPTLVAVMNERRRRVRAGSIYRSSFSSR